MLSVVSTVAGEVEALIREAVVLHVESLRTRGEAVPEPTMTELRFVHTV